MRVAGFGEIMLRLSTTKGTTFKQSNNFNVNYGGGEANVLISLSNFDIDTRMITKVSNDDIGKSIIKYLKSNDVDTTFIKSDDKRTGIYFLEVGSGNRASKVIYDRADSAFSNMNMDDLNIEQGLENVDVFHFSGITLALSEELRKLTMKILKHCKENNILVSYDSNYRAKLWSIEEARKATLEILPYVKEVVKFWNEYVTQDLSDEELKVLMKMMDKLVYRAKGYFENQAGKNHRQNLAIY